MTEGRARQRSLDLPSPRVFADTSEAMGRWASRRLNWWHRRRVPAPTPPPEAQDGAPSGAPTAEAPPEEPVLLAVSGPVATVTLNRPGRRNALNLASWQALGEVAARLAADPAVRVVVLTGETTFSAGSDIGEFPAARLGAEAARRYNEVYEGALGAWAALTQPVIARIPGYCLGAALELALTADFRIAAEDATLGIPAVKLGIGISVADARRLIDVVGPARARTLLLSGDRITADRALALGLVDDVAPAADLAARVEARIRDLLANAPQTMAWIKRAAAFAVRHPDTGAFAFDVLGTQVFDTRDCAEGVDAFLSGRRPEFTGT
jgi:enoyl-CoA hydratase/carnithine racemase